MKPSAIGGLILFIGLLVASFIFLTREKPQPNANNNDSFRPLLTGTKWIAKQKKTEIPMFEIHFREGNPNNNKLLADVKDKRNIIHPGKSGSYQGLNLEFKIQVNGGGEAEIKAEIKRNDKNNTDEIEGNLTGFGGLPTTGFIATKIPDAPR
jgi:hypothetical protein